MNSLVNDLRAVLDRVSAGSAKRSRRRRNNRGGGSRDPVQAKEAVAPRRKRRRARRSGVAAAEDGQLRLSKFELFTTVNTDAAGKAHGSLGLHPTNIPLLKSLFRAFERIQWHSARIVWKPAVGSTVGGLVTFGVDWDSKGASTDRVSVSAYSPSCTTACWKETSPAQFVLPSSRLMSRKNYLPAAGDSVDQQPGQLVWAVEGPLSTFVGEFWIRYDVTCSGTKPAQGCVPPKPATSYFRGENIVEGNVDSGAGIPFWLVNDDPAAPSSWQLDIKPFKTHEQRWFTDTGRLDGNFFRPAYKDIVQTKEESDVRFFLNNREHAQSPVFGFEIPFGIANIGDEVEFRIEVMCYVPNTIREGQNLPRFVDVKTENPWELRVDLSSFSKQILKLSTSSTGSDVWTRGFAAVGSFIADKVNGDIVIQLHTNMQFNWRQTAHFCLAYTVAMFTQKIALRGLPGPTFFIPPWEVQPGDTFDDDHSYAFGNDDSFDHDMAIDWIEVSGAKATQTD